MSSLTNADFKVLLQTPRDPKDRQSSSREPVRSQNSVREKSKAKSKEYYVKRERQKQKKEHGSSGPTESAHAAPKYRDRAEERRKNVNPDYAGIDETALQKQAQPFGAGETRADLIEKSKFLGGDLHYTHLVKGLDLVLLEKTQSQVADKQLQQDSADKDQRKQVQQTAPGKHVTHSAIAARITALVLKPREDKVSELFLPRRMTFVYDLEDNTYAYLPTTLLRAKEDCPDPEERTSGRCEPEVLEMVERLCHYTKQGTHKRKKRRELHDEHSHRAQPQQHSQPQQQQQQQQQLPQQKHQQQPQSSNVVAQPDGGSDDEIFGDAGSYDTRQQHAMPPPALQAPKQSYFQRVGESSALGPAPPTSEPAPPEDSSLDMINKTLAVAHAQNQLTLAEQRFADYHQSRKSAQLQGPNSIYHNPIDPKAHTQSTHQKLIAIGAGGYDDCDPDDYNMDISSSFIDSDDEDDDSQKKPKKQGDAQGSKKKRKRGDEDGASKRGGRQD